MTREEVLSLSPAKLCAEAHKILGLNIVMEWQGGNENRTATNWVAKFDDGSVWNRAFKGVDEVDEMVLDRLNVSNFCRSWDSASELFEHEKWPEGYTVALEAGAFGTRNYYVRDCGTRSIDETVFVCGGIELGEVITRAFVIANSSVESK